MGGKPLLHFLGVVDLGLIGYDGEVREERHGVRAIKRLQQIQEEPGLLAIPHLIVMVPVVRSSAPAR